MFNFTTTTIINDPNVIVKGTEEVLIKRVARFKKANVTSVTRAEATPEVVPTAKIRIPDITPGAIYRLALYVRLSGSENSYYANDFVQKGKPFFIEAVADGNSSKLAKDLVANAKKYITMVYEKELVKLYNDASGSSIIDIKGIDGFQQFKMVELQKWEDDTNFPGAGNWKTVIPTEKAEVTAGNPGFGTYRHLLYNYVLPTGANLRFNALNQNEAPIVDATYNQYILTMKTNRGVMGGAAVGQPVESVTQHVFWVKSDIVTAFETAMKEITDQGKINVDKDVKTDNGELNA